MKKWLLILFLFIIGTAFSQEEILQTQHTGYLQLGTHFQGWRIENQTVPINQLSIPLMLMFPIGDQMHLILSHRSAYTWWEEDNTINGPSDTWVQLNYMLAKDRVLVNFGLGIPTGKTHLNNDQFLLSQLLSRNIFRFSMPVYGQGFCIKGGIAGAYPLNERIILGLGAQYIKKGSYNPVDYTYTYPIGNEIYSETFSPKYQAGNEISGQVGLDIMLSKDMKLMFDVMMTYYNRDMMDGQEVYGSGQKLVVEGGLFYRFQDDKYAWGHLLFRRKGKSEIRQGFTFEEEEYNSSGYQFETDFHVDMSSAENAKFALLAHGRFYGENEYGVGSANLLGGGIGMNYEITTDSIIDFQVKYLTGRTDDRRIEGMEILIFLKFKF
ncbi:hypothetical protein HQ585_19010 [candidate division KSB1 bacterium]|nr:hypothetical protein [candidate division KSB1 bacterium]